MNSYEVPWRPNIEIKATIAWMIAIALVALLSFRANLPRYPFYVMLAVSGIMIFYRGSEAIKRAKGLARLKRGQVELISWKKFVKMVENKKESSYMGRGFTWGPHELELVTELQKRGPEKFLGKKAVKEGAYYIHGVGSEEYVLDFPLKLQSGHTLIAGTTGAGKTRCFDLLISQAILRGEPVIIYDPKGDHELREKARRACEKIGKAHKFVCFHPAYPDVSVRLDPLRNWNRSTELASRIATLIPSETGGDPFTAFSWMALNNIVNGLLAVEERPNLVKLRRFIEGEPGPLVIRALRGYFERKVKDWESRIAPYLKKMRGKEVEAYILFYQTEVINEFPSPEIDGLVSSYTHNREHLQKMTASLLPILNMLTGGTLGPLLSPEPDPDDNRAITDMSRIIENGYVAYIGLDSLSDGTVGSAIGSIMLADLTAVAGDRYNYSKDFKPVNIFIDEAAEIINPPTIQMLNKGRGAGFRLFIATQTLADFEVRTGSEAAARQALGNINNKIILRVMDAETQKYVSEGLDKTVIRSLQQQYRSGSSSSDPSSFNGMYGESLAETEADLLPSDILGKLPNLHFFATLADGKLYKGRIPILDPADG